MALGLNTSKSASNLKELQRTSSLNDYALCDLCGRREKNKKDLRKHLLTCQTRRTCSWCNIVFKNRGNLFSHLTRIHSEKVSEQKNLRTGLKNRHKCSVCPKSYTQPTNLKYHIRKEHFNMISRVTEGEQRTLNEVWLERVHNTDAVAEIKKAKYNMYLIKKASKNNTLEISEPKDSIDLSPLYPTHVRTFRVWCDICQKTYYKRDFGKHIKEKHENIRRHECNKCHKKFNRPYQYLQHNCSRKPQRCKSKRVKKFVHNITIED